MNEALFEQWTRRHIALVGRNLRRMVGYGGLRTEELAIRAREHDASKFRQDERAGYVWLTWKLAHKTDLPAEAERLIDAALKLHRSRNRHHPEFHPDCNDMTRLDLVEMVCDWHAIALESGGGIEATRRWAEVNVPRKWSFSAARIREIGCILTELGRRQSVGLVPQEAWPGHSAQKADSPPILENTCRAGSWH